MAHGTITAGTALSANNTSVTPAIGTHASGDTLLCVAVVRSTAATLACATAGWTAADGITNPVAGQGACRFFFFQNEADSAAESDPVITTSGGAAGDTVTAVVLRLQGRDFAQNFTLGTVSLNSTANATNILFAQNSPSIDNGNAIIAIGHKLDDYTVAPATLSGQTAGLTWGQLVRHSTTLGNDHSVAIDSAINATGSAYTAGTGGSMAGATFSAAAASSGVYLESPGAAAATSFPPFDRLSNQRALLVR